MVHNMCWWRVFLKGGVLKGDFVQSNLLERKGVTNRDLQGEEVDLIRGVCETASKRKSKTTWTDTILLIPKSSSH